jgi:RimJ/RimL family protein N-acetyltransferase
VSRIRLTWSKIWDMTETDGVHLRPIEEADLDEMVRYSTDADAQGQFEWMGFRDPRMWRRRWEEDGWIGEQSTWLAIATADGTFAGVVSWRDHSQGSNRQACFEIGASLLPAYRGKGLGTAAQRALVEHLWSTTHVHRLQASTEADNLAEQRVLEKIGFEREGRLREAFFRAGRWRDSLVYGLLRPQPAGDS